MAYRMVEPGQIDAVHITHDAEFPNPVADS